MCDQVDQGDQVVPAHQVDDIDEVHELDPVHQVDHKDEPRFCVEVVSFCPLCGRQPRFLRRSRQFLCPLHVFQVFFMLFHVFLCFFMFFSCFFFSYLI